MSAIPSIFVGIDVSKDHLDVHHLPTDTAFRVKKVVWTYTEDRKVGVHHSQILDNKGQPEGKAIYR